MVYMYRLLRCVRPYRRIRHAVRDVKNRRYKIIIRLAVEIKRAVPKPRILDEKSIIFRRRRHNGRT